MSDVDISKLKVTELREELKKHGLDTKGKKEQLVKRLENFLSGSGEASLGEGDAALAQEDDEPATEESQTVEESQTAEEQQQQSTEEPPAEASVPEASAAAEEAAPQAMETAPAEESAEQPEEMEQTTTETDEVKKEDPEVKTEAVAANDAAEGGEKRKRSHSPEPKTGDSPSHKRERKEVPAKSDDDWIDSEELTLDRFNCDLNIEVVNEGYTIKPNSYGGFGYMWGGLRANYGVTDGKVAFQVKTVKNLRIQIGEESLGANHVSRVGWSIDCGNFQLGEYPKSYGYGGTAKFSTNSKFTDFNVKYYNGDVVTCYLDMTGENAIMYFAKNDMQMEKAIEVPKSELDGAPLFPAFASKNQILEVNFGQMEKPWFPLLGEEGEYTFIGKLPVEQRVRALKPPRTKDECEVLLLVGLPGAGKSYWAIQKQNAEPDRRYYVLGTNNIIDKMKVEGLPRKNNYHGRWDVLFDQANECLRKMLETANKRVRNYILDQTNVYDTAQRRKMRPFVGFKRKAVVVLPTDKVFRERIEKRTKEEGKEVPESAVLEMKANFSMPYAPVEIALNPEANEIALREEEERRLKEEEERKAKEEERKAKEEAERLAKEKKEQEEKEAAEKAKAEAAEKGEGEEPKAEGDESKTEGEESKTEGEEPSEESSTAKEEDKAAADAEQSEEKAAADAAETEKEVKDEPEVKAESAEENKETKEEAEEVKAEPEKMEETEESATAEDAANEDGKAQENGEPKPDEEKTQEEAKKEEKKEEPEVVFDEVLFTELSGDVARKLLAEYVKEGQQKFPPGSRRFRREDRRIGKDDRGGFRNDYRPHDGGYRDRRDYNSGYGRGGYGGRYNSGGGYGQGRGGYDNRNRNYGGGYGGYNKGGPGGYRSGGGYAKSYGGGGWGGQGGGGWGGQGGYGGGGGWGGQGGYGQGYGQGGWGGGYGQGGYGGGGGGHGYGGQGGYGGGGGGGYSGGGGGGNWGGSGHSGGSSWNQGGYGGSGSGYGGYGGGSGY